MKNEMKDIDEYAELYGAIQEKTGDDAVAIAILQELGKDKRTQMIQSVQHSADDAPATEKQKAFLSRLGVEFAKDISKKEASHLIEENK